MIYDLSNSIDLEKFKIKSTFLIGNNKRVEVKEVRQKRSLSHNAYLHVCVSLFAIEFGYTLDEAKTLLKRNCEFMRYSKNEMQFLKKTSLMDSKELTEFIEWIRNYSGLQGLYIPTSEEYLTNRFEIDKNISNHKTYL